jgi:hypothetical protein
MTLAEMLLIFILAVLVIFLVYYFLRGSTGRVSLSRPVESRVDEYLDRRFERIVEEWSLVRRPRLQKFKDERNEALDRDEERIEMLMTFESEMKTSLDELEDRLYALEDSLAAKKSSRR